MKFLRSIADAFQSRRKIETRIPETLPSLMGDQEALASVIANLIDNAIKYSPAPQPVRLSASVMDGWLSISVSDQGRGISLHDQHSIFERFYRGGNGSTREVKGVGLGLALVKHIVNAHGGEISVESQLGQGSTFTVRLKEGTG